MYPCQIIKLPEPIRCLTPAWLAATALVSPPTFPPRPERLPGVSRLISTGRTVRSCCSRPAPPAAEAVRFQLPQGPGAAGTRRLRQQPRLRRPGRCATAPPGVAAPPWRPRRPRSRREHRPQGGMAESTGPTAAPQRPHIGPQRPHSGPT